MPKTFKASYEANSLLVGNGSVDYTAFAVGSAGAAVTKILAATAGYRNVVEGISFSMSIAPSAAVTVSIFDGPTEVDRWYVLTAGASFFQFPRPIRGTSGLAMSASISAPGGSVIAAVNFHGARLE